MHVLSQEGTYRRNPGKHLARGNAPAMQGNEHRAHLRHGNYRKRVRQPSVFERLAHVLLHYHKRTKTKCAFRKNKKAFRLNEVRILFKRYTHFVLAVFTYAIFPTICLRKHLPPDTRNFALAYFRDTKKHKRHTFYGFVCNVRISFCHLFPADIVKT